MFLKSRDERGFTLVEILVVIALVAIMSGLGYAGFQNMIQRQRTIAAVNRVISLLKEAQVLAREKRAICYVTLNNDTNGTMDLTLDTDYSGSTNSTATDTLARQVKISRQFRDVVVRQGASFRYDYRGIPAGVVPTAALPIGIGNQNKPSLGNATITVSNMGDISVAIPDSWKR